MRTTCKIPGLAEFRFLFGNLTINPSNRPTHRDACHGRRLRLDRPLCVLGRSGRSVYDGNGFDPVWARQWPVATASRQELWKRLALGVVKQSLRVW